MKSTTVIWLIAAAFLVVIGSLLFAAVMTANHWDFAALGRSKFEIRTVDITEEFQLVSIQTDTDDIFFRLSDDGKCSVVFDEHVNERHTASVQNGTLSIGVTDTGKWYEHISVLIASPKMTVYLPAAEYDSLSVKGSTGDIVLPRELSFGSMDISVSTGDVSSSASASGLIRIKSGTGDIRLENLSAGELDLTVSTGKVDVRSATCGGNFGVSVSTGKTLLTDVTCGSLVSDGSTGDITLRDVIAAEKISVERSTGDVSFERNDAAELFIKTGSGDVTGSLLSEKVFIAQSNTGRVKVPETTIGGKCEIRTNTGKISIDIE